MKSKDKNESPSRMEKAENAVRNIGKATRIILRVVWILFGLLILSLLVFVAVRLVQAVRGDLSAFLNLFESALISSIGK